MSKKSSQSQVFDKVEDAVFTFRIKKKTVQGAKGDKEEERRRERNKEKNGEGRKDNDIRGFYAQEKVERRTSSCARSRCGTADGVRLKRGDCP